MKFFARFAQITFLLIWPVHLVMAQESAADLAKGFVGKFNDIILYPLIILLMSVALLVFLYGGFEYIARSDNETARATGKQHMLWGIIGLLVMISAFAILEIAAATFGLTTQLNTSL